MILGMLRRFFREGAASGKEVEASSKPSEDAVALKLKGNESFAKRRLADAEYFYREALRVDPAYDEALNNLGCVLDEQGRKTDAEAAFNAALSANPRLPEAFKNLGDLYRSQRKFAEAERKYRRCAELLPDYADAYNNLGVILNQCGRFSKAEESYRHALRLRPGYGAAIDNLCTMLTEQGREREAEAAYRDFVVRFPNDIDAQFLFSLFLLRLGKFEEGWAYHESRYDPRVRDPVAPLPAVPYPQWRGEALAGKSLLVWYEQGYGDEIQFCRLVPLLKREGAAYLTLVCKPQLLRLFQTLDGADRVVSVEDGSSLPAHDYWVLPLSIPLYFNIRLATIPATLPYLSAEEDRITYWQGAMPEGRFRVGLAWKGNGRHNNDVNRSLPSLGTLSPLWDVEGVSFVSLQKGAGEDEASVPLAHLPLVDLGSRMRDFADCAAIISQLDLVICVDTAAAHLAGALGKPCWVMLPCVGTDWRWLLHRTDSPWYPGTIKLFRQRKPGDWETVVEELTVALRAFAV